MLTSTWRTFVPSGKPFPKNQTRTFFVEIKVSLGFNSKGYSYVYSGAQKSLMILTPSHDKLYGESSNVGTKQLNVATLTSFDITNNVENTEIRDINAYKYMYRKYVFVYCCLYFYRVHSTSWDGTKNVDVSKQKACAGKTAAFPTLQSLFIRSCDFLSKERVYLIIWHVCIRKLG